ncbi:MAG: hypothetical protein CMG25_04880 [Candidatus Marinimicrobia bacterium]|nr:hypothetical protein [Candidatus Neomarinimicrobiota bacterium]|tara:strand:- start:5304 stop:6710 length:1407 start_codon:yes stop_codon:yes gene_type:complete
MSTVFASSLDMYLPFENNSNEYYVLEYQIIKNKSFDDIFIFKQPYTYNEINKISTENYFNFHQKTKLNSELSFRINPGFSSNGEQVSLSPYLDISSIIKIDNTTLKIGVDFDKRLINDDSFHGDKNEILTGYVREAYLLSKFNNLEFFAGRLSRNYGILNEYSLIFSNNSFPFDHYGFSLSGNKTNYSFYVSRLNDYEDSIDSEGILIPLDSIMTTKRFFSFQHLDLKLSRKIQLGLSQSIVYGGQNQTFEGLYINPINFYYSDQRNSRVQMNGFWQLLFSYKITDKSMLYLDFLVDDFIVNNDEPDERDKNPDRLGVIVKYSFIDFICNQTLNTLTYTRISNDTYISFRNFENYFYQLKGIGYSQNSYESMKLTSTYIGKLPTIYNFQIKFNKEGNSNLFRIFEAEKNSFPLTPILYSINLSGAISCLVYEKVRFFYQFLYTLESNQIDFFETSNIVNHNIRVVYEL